MVVVTPGTLVPNGIGLGPIDTLRAVGVIGTTVVDIVIAAIDEFAVGASDFGLVGFAGTVGP